MVIKTLKTAFRVLLVLLLLVICIFLYLFWPVLRTASGVIRLEDGLYSVEFQGDYGLDAFLEQGGAESDAEAAEFVIDRLFRGMVSLELQGGAFGCSTLSTVSGDGEFLFGRNFDWGSCNALIVHTRPAGRYASISTVNMDFLNLGLRLPEVHLVRLMSAAAPYAPMDGMNEKGLCVAVLMIEDSPAFSQDTGKPDLTTTTAVRLLLDKAADVEEALALLGQYDLHASAGMMVHLALADASGRSVVAEYINNELVATETPVVTNFYLTPGVKYGVGTAESRTRYQILKDMLNASPTMEMDEVQNALERVGKRNFDSPFASTEWSIIWNQTSGEIRYYHRENYEQFYSFSVR